MAHLEKHSFGCCLADRAYCQWGALRYLSSTTAVSILVFNFRVSRFRWAIDCSFEHAEILNSSTFTSDTQKFAKTVVATMLGTKFFFLRYYLCVAIYVSGVFSNGENKHWNSEFK